MSDRHYLIKVLGLSAMPRLVTFGLTMISFPLMVRAVGASELGVVVFIGAIISVLESFVDFGVSSAAGKDIAAARETRVVPLYAVIRKWAYLQATVALIGLGPLLGVTYLVASASSNIEFSLQVLVILVFATWITISLNFVRACLSSVLAFKSLAALDAFESILRSASWLCVAFYAPSTLGLALASVITAGCASAFGSVIIWRFLAGNKARTPTASANVFSTHSTLNTNNMLMESLNFLWLRLATRVFQSIPVMVFGKLFGSEVVGIVGAFSKIVELINFPFGVIGNALAVRAAGVMAKGNAAAKALWDVVSRLLGMSLMIAVTIQFGAKLIAELVLPGSRDAGTALAILSITVVTTAISSVIAPMSDYVGALKSRNILLTVFSLIQVIVIWIGGRALGQTGAFGAYVLVLALMNCGYVLIALRAFFPETYYHLRSEVRYFLAIAATALLLASLFHKVPGLDHLPMLGPFNVAFFEIAFFWTFVMAGLMLHQAAKAFFLTKAFFDFQA